MSEGGAKWRRKWRQEALVTVSFFKLIRGPSARINHHRRLNITRDGEPRVLLLAVASSCGEHCRHFVILRDDGDRHQRLPIGRARVAWPASQLLVAPSKAMLCRRPSCFVDTPSTGAPVDGGATDDWAHASAWPISTTRVCVTLLYKMAIRPYHRPHGATAEGAIAQPEAVGLLKWPSISSRKCRAKGIIRYTGSSRRQAREMVKA